MIYKINIGKDFGRQLGENVAYIYKLGVSAVDNKEKD